MRTAPPPVGRLIETVRTRGVSIIQDRLRHFRTNLIIVAQAGVATALAWTVASIFLHNRDAFFAPVIALGAVVSSQTQRLRRTLQLVSGVVLGVAVGELFILFIGTGYWQVGLSVVIAISIAIAVKGGTSLMYQSGSTAILISALPASSHVDFPRLINATIGAATGLVVVILFLPLHPLRAISRATTPALLTLAERLTGSAEALGTRDADRARTELEQLGDIGPHLDHLHDAVEGAREVVNLAPIRWSTREAFGRYEHTVDHVDDIFRNCEPLLRRTVTLIEDKEPVPAHLTAAVDHLSTAVRLLDKEYDSERVPRRTRDMALCAVSDAGEAYAEGLGFSGSVVVAQVRTASTDLLRATGLEYEEANRLVRGAVGEEALSQTNLPQE